MGKGANKHGKKDKAERLDARNGDNRIDSDNEDSEETTITVSLSDLRNVIRNEVNSQLSDFNDSLTRLIEELRSDLALRLDCVDNRVNDTLTEHKRVKHDLSSEIDKLCSHVRKISEDLSATTTANTTSRAALPVKTVSPVSTNDLHDALSEINEREKKKDNLIYFNVKEKENGSTEEKIKNDTDIYKGICDNIGVAQHDIKSIYRIGKFHPDKIRPLIVKTDNDVKLSILKNVHKLKK
jgi:hypothetical protein